MSDNIFALHSGRQKFRHSFLNVKRLFASIVPVRPRLAEDWFCQVLELTYSTSHTALTKLFWTILKILN